ncbi:MAG TPA: amidohydrolase family protein [Candidatus Binataceae bacterium]|jgi:dihydropyrimidinase|nr:amidohydrolase family protein [Candidatus Binataceae bacterium]
MYDLIIRGGQVVTPGGVGNWDVAIAGEKIVLIGEAGAEAQAGRIIDVAGKIIVPGGIEPHTHLNTPVMMQPGQRLMTLGPELDTIGMAFGGTTTHLDFCFVNPALDIPGALARRTEQWKGRSLIDYSFHVTLTGALPLATFDQLGDAIAAGFPTFKVFTTDLLPPHPNRRGSMRLDHGRIHWAMQKLAKHGGLMTVHAEDDDLVQFNYERFLHEGRVGGADLAHVHTNLSEQVSFNRVIELASATGAAVYFVHVSAHQGVQAVGAARARGLPVYGETLHQYACFNAEHYKAPRGFCYHTYPSLKFPDDQAALWDGLVGGGISTAATDEFPTSLEVKLLGKRIDDVTGGNVGAEARMGIVYTEGVVKRAMSLQRFAEVTSTNAARIMGLYPRKGVIAPGSDADLCIIDPQIHKRLAREDFHVSDYSPWEGWEIHGWPVMTLLRGKVIVEDGRLGKSVDYGRLVARHIDPVVLRRPSA